ncbi:hypothetical protein ONZ45_g12555 [Pleurotus djamor]|nr:hypothetical protein ONZ45_g12555 [Pleurotus djamor]
MEPRRPSVYTSGDTTSSVRRCSGYQASHTLYPAEPIPHTSSPPSAPNFATSTDELFTEIDLTQNAPTREASYSSMFSHVTRTSQLTRLPTPDFTTFGNFRSVLDRGLSFMSIPVQPPAGFLSRRSSSRSTTTSGRSFYSNASRESGTVLSGIGTTEKFTAKWPRPKTLKYSQSSESTNALGPVYETLPYLGGDKASLGVETMGRWNKFKWTLFLSVLLLLAYSMVLLVASMSVWFRTWARADIISVTDNDILILATISASALLMTFVVGLTGVLLNSRPILAVYTLLLWPSFISVLVIGYVSYKRGTFALDRKLQRAWSQDYTQLGRLMIQNSLGCCGWFNALHEVAVSNRCYPRAPLPGCKAALIVFEETHLEVIWKTVFGLIAPMHIINIFVALLCSNHVNETFGKGITPRKYWLTVEDVRRDKEVVREKLRMAGSEVPLARPLYARSGSTRYKDRL